MPLSNLPGPWRWEKRDGYWWRIHTELNIEDGPHSWDDLNLGRGGFASSEFGSRWYDRDGEPIPMLVGGDLKSDFDYAVIAKDVFVFDGAPVEVSTVWLGLDHNWMGGRPLIFETMIFGGQQNLECWRYSTEEEAREGHANAVVLLQIANAGGQE